MVTTTTPEWWSIDGVSLNQYGWNIETVGGSRYGVPATRGDDVHYAYVPGQEWRPKLPDSRVITLNMWVLGVDPDTGKTTDNTLLRWNDSWNFLRHLLWQPNRQFELTRRWLLTDADGNPAIRTATALGQINGNLDLTMNGRFRGQFTVDIVLADPFFYGAEIVSQVNLNTNRTLENPGDYIAAHRNMSVQLVGPLNYPELSNTSADPKVTLKLDTTILAGETVTLDMAAFTAISTDPKVIFTGASTKNRIVYVKHTGARQWMGLLRGTNVLKLSAGAGSSGHAVVRFQPPYV